MRKIPLIRVFLLFTIVSLIGCGEIVTFRAARYNDLLSLPPADQKMVPNIIPAQAYNIYVTYDMDTSATNIAFTLDSEGLHELRKLMWRINFQEFASPRMLVGEPWWPKYLNDKDATAMLKSTVEFYQFSEGTTEKPLVWNAAIDDKARLVFMWH